MRNTIKKITAALASAVLCAVPMASAMSANAIADKNARFTFRQTYYVDATAKVTEVRHAFSCKRYNTDVPVAEKTSRYLNYSGGGSAGDTYYNCGGTLTGSGSYLAGVVLSVSTYCNDPSDFHQGTTYARGYKADGTESPNSVRSFNTFLVGDLNGDKKVNGTDSSLLENALRNCGAAGKDFKSQIYINGQGYDAYKFDIDGNGAIGWSDLTLMQKYERGQIVRFAK